MITIATKPKIQNKVLKHLLQRKYSQIYFLEKPVKESLSIIKNFQKAVF